LTVKVVVSVINLHFSQVNDLNWMFATSTFRRL